MTDYLTLYKIYNMKTNTLSDFVDHEGLHDFILNLNYEGKSIEDYRIYSLPMQDITRYLDFGKLNDV